MSVGVDGEGDAPLPYDPPEQEQVAYCGLPFLEDGVGCRPGRIIDCQMQGQYWAAILQPGMMAAIDLEEHPRLGHALSAHPVSGTAVPWTWESRPHQQTPHRRTRYHQTLSLRFFSPPMTACIRASGEDLPWGIGPGGTDPGPGPPRR